MILFRQCDGGEYGDITFCVHGTYLKSHRCILSARSEYFADMFHNRWKDRQVIQVTHKLVQTWAFKAILWYLHTGSTNIVCHFTDGGGGGIQDFIMRGSHFVWRLTTRCCWKVIHNSAFSQLDGPAVVWCGGAKGITRKGGSLHLRYSFDIPLIFTYFMALKWPLCADLPFTLPMLWLILSEAQGRIVF